jgi:hypothetical protein
MELVKWQDVVRTAELLYLFLKELHQPGIEDLVRKV